MNFTNYSTLTSEHLKFTANICGFYRPAENVALDFYLSLLLVAFGVLVSAGNILTIKILQSGPSVIIQGQRSAASTSITTLFKALNFSDTICVVANVGITFLGKYYA